MRPWPDTGGTDGNGNGADPGEWLEQLNEWRKSQREAKAQQASDRVQLDAAEGRAAAITGWLGRLTDALQDTNARAVELDAVAAQIADADAAVSEIEGLLADHEEARATATARLLGGPDSEVPLVLLPLRVQTAWDGPTLTVRVYPDDVGVDAHDARLSADERAAGEAYWAMRAGGASAGALQAWENLLRHAPAPRAAWIARATDPDPSAPTSGAKDSAWDVRIRTVTLPDRFAVIAYAGGEPINLAPAGQPPRHVSWGSAVNGELTLEALQEPGAADWMTDPDTAIAAGMAMRIEVPESAPPIEQLLVVGVRSAAADLAGLLEAHAYTGGLEILADGTPTNNSDTVRAAHSPRHDAEVAAALLDGGALAPGDGSAGAQLADALGIAREALAGISGAGADRHTTTHAAGLVVALATEGPDPGLPTADAAALAPLLAPAGPAPTVRIGRQPYGVLPTTAPARWQPADGEATAVLAPVLGQWGWARGAAVDRDPALPWSPPPSARRITRGDDSPLHELLIEHPHSIAWADGEAIAYDGLDGLLGPAEGPQSAAAYLEALATATDSELDALAGTLPPALLARLALAARRAAATQGSELAAALHALAGAAGDREELARLVAQQLDARSHRADAWLTAAAAERLGRQRAAGATAGAAVGAYGYLTDVAPRSAPRSHGHVHAPSLGHAATAAVLRSGYLGERRAAWAAAVAQARADREQALEGPARDAAQAALDAAEAGLAELRPLDPGREATIPLAIDLSSRRVRGARRLLAAARGGQPLTAVLGYEFERDLADAGLQQYLAAFRKLTRFATGTKLEALEQARADARDALRAAQQRLTELRVAIEDTQPALDAATAALAQASSAEAAARAVAAPYLAMRAELAELEQTGIGAAEAALAAVDAARPTPAVKTRTIEVP
jgi:hypothetical protein